MKDINNKKFRMVYSSSLDEIVVKEFICMGRKYIWNDLDCVYYWEESDESWFYEVPTKAIATARISDKELNDKARQLKEAIQKQSIEKVKSTLNDMKVLILARDYQDYTEVFKTDMYIKHGSEYCLALEILYSWENK